MREIFENSEDAAKHDPVAAARSASRPVLAKRFYKQVAFKASGNGFAILLDGKPVKTPGQRALLLSGENSAGIVAAEWQAQKIHINPLDMPATRIVNTAIDGVADESQAVFEDILRFAGSDLVCYRANSPAGLVREQQTHWDPVLDWMQADIGAQFEVTSGIVHVAQSKQAIAAFGARLKPYSDPIELACLHQFTSLTGSALIALALVEGFFNADTAWSAAHVDEDWNIKTSGKDDEAKLRRAQRWKEMAAAFALLNAVRDDRAS